MDKIISPVANGSKVPQWPTTAGEPSSRRRLRTWITNSREVIPNGLSINKNPNTAPFLEPVAYTDRFATGETRSN
jgi:hypothetical protein